MNIDRVKKEFESIAKEPMTVEDISGSLYGFGSELACLRLFYKYNIATRNPKTEAKFSAGRKSWYFRLEP